MGVRELKSQWNGWRTLVSLLALFAGGAAHSQPQTNQTVQKQTAPPPPLTSELLVFLKPGTAPGRFAADYGLQFVRRLQSDPNACVFSAFSPAAAEVSRWQAASDRRVRRAWRNVRAQKERYAFVPNDPYFPFHAPTTDWPGQWYLLNQIAPGMDAGVQGAWNRDLTGQGVTIGIVDDGLETAHPDLSPAYSATDSFDFGQNDADPNPVFSADRHGTAVAGIAAARGGNGIGIAGAAPFASLAGLRIDFGSSPVSDYVDATLYHSSGANTNIKIKNHSYGYFAPFILADAESEALMQSAQAGTIHTYAAGNLRGGAAEDSNKLDEQNSPDVICVAALGDAGTFAAYSNFGACVFVTAPSDNAGSLRVTTTDRMGANGYNTSASDGDLFPDLDYTGTFGGTSAASPVVAGVMALGKQAQPELDVRFAKHLLTKTTVLIDPSDITSASDGGWKTNAAGLKFNQNYGFGLINADAFTQEAVRYSSVTPLETVSTGIVTVNASIPDNDATGVSRTFVLNATTSLEEILVTLSITHNRRGELEAHLTSPAGTTSRLFRRQTSDTGSNINWTFCSNAFWGENPSGTWTLTVKDTQAARMGTWTSYAVTARMGRLVGQTVAGTILLEDCANSAQMVNLEFRPQPSGTAFQRAVMLDANGAFSVTDLPAGNYNVAIKGAKWLQQVVALDVSTSSVLNLAAFLRAGDADESNTVDVLDLDLLIQAFDATPESPNWNPNADFNCDGSVDVLDLDLLIRNFDTEGDA